MFECIDDFSCYVHFEVVTLRNFMKFVLHATEKTDESRVFNNFMCLVSHAICD